MRLTAECVLLLSLSAPFSPLSTRNKVLPIERGAGLDQKLLLNFSRKLAAGGWCHIFPEGKTVQVCVPVCFCIRVRATSLLLSYTCTTRSYGIRE